MRKYKVHVSTFKKPVSGSRNITPGLPSSRYLHFKKPNYYLTSYRSVLSAFKLCINGILHAFMPDFFCPVYCCAHHSNSYSNYQDHFAEEETEVYL